MSAARRFRYAVTLEWRGTIDIEPEDGGDDETLHEAALDLAIDTALAYPGGYALVDYDLTDEGESEA